MTFEYALRSDLHTYLKNLGELDEMLPDAPDIENKWESIATAYLPDGIREFNGYPVVSLGWIMYVGMAIAKYWDDDWDVYGKIDDIYTYIRDKRDYDHMDEYIRKDVLLLKGKAFTDLEKLVGECASRTYNALRHQNIEPGTKAAFDAYISCLHQLYLMGSAIQLKRMGYKMTLL